MSDKLVRKSENTKIKNVKVKYIRPEYNNLKDWCNGENNFYVGRKGIVFINGERYPKKDSAFANIYKVGRDGTLDEVLIKYKIYIEDKIIHNPELLEELRKMEGGNLGCWCFPEKCHSNILVELMEKYL